MLLTAAPIRMTVVGYRSHPAQKDLELLVYSPFPPAEVAEAVRVLGAVRFIIAPNTMHHVWAGEFRAAFPDAVLIAPYGLAAKRKDIAFDVLLSSGEAGQGTGTAEHALSDRMSAAGTSPEASGTKASTSPATGKQTSTAAVPEAAAVTSLPGSWPNEQLKLKLIPGFKSEEIVVLHVPSKTLVIADLAFNIDKTSDEVPLPKPPFSW